MPQFLQLHYWDHQPIISANGFQHINKSLFLFKPEINTDETASIVSDCFHKWVSENKYTLIPDSLTTRYSLGDKSFTSDELFKEFLAVKSVYTIRYQS